mmetsp:Transcript_11465/g.18446  ORF Transcript_11465/g.18446 Transcript_11465/m.18446 type:complete len:222 (-) Transcript_11465:44-709(-)
MMSFADSYSTNRQKNFLTPLNRPNYQNARSNLTTPISHVCRWQWHWHSHWYYCCCWLLCVMATDFAKCQQIERFSVRHRFVAVIASWHWPQPSHRMDWHCLWASRHLFVTLQSSLGLPRDIGMDDRAQEMATWAMAGSCQLRTVCCCPTATVERLMADSPPGCYAGCQRFYWRSMRDSLDLPPLSLSLHLQLLTVCAVYLNLASREIDDFSLKQCACKIKQ